MPNDMPGAGRFVQARMQIPNTQVYGVASWRGNSMQQHSVAPTLTNASFTTSGKGKRSLTVDATPSDARFPRGPRISGRQGALDILLDGGATTTVTIASLLQESSGLVAVLVSLVSGVVNVTIKNSSGVNVGVLAAASLATVANGRSARIQVAWNSVTPIESTRHMKVLINGLLAPPGDYTTAPTAAWAYLQPTDLDVPYTFDGELRSFQAASSVEI
jgi:hypothetical protein